MLKHIINKDDLLFFEKKVSVIYDLGEHLKKMTPNSDLQFIYKKSGNSMTTAKCQIVAPLDFDDNFVNETAAFSSFRRATSFLESCLIICVTLSYLLFTNILT